MQNRASSNLYSMVLRPTAEDCYLRCEAANPIFSVAHKSAAREIDTSVSQLQQALMQAYRSLSYEATDSKSQVTHQVLAQLRAVLPVDFEQLKQILMQTVNALLNVSVDFSKTQQGTPINQKSIDEDMGFDSLTTTPEEYIKALLGYCAPDLFDTVVESPFNTLTQAESWSIATQFLLGLTNFYCVAQGKISPDTNFGRIMDSRPALSQALAQTLAQAQQQNHSIEEACLSWMNEHASELKLSALTHQDRVAIKKIFAERYTAIKDSPHFDEFFLLDTQKKGDFFIHQSSICTSFAKFASSPLFDLPQELTQSMEKARGHAGTLSTELPHKNPLAQGEVEINTATIGNTALWALYKRINAYQEPSLKQQLLAQLKQERPDFDPQRDAKQLLQHVAYGEQDEAEILLQKDPELAQELLRANNITFTDYSGRTFTCTAYEYAWWAKDAHMLKMLEKYIKQDEETRRFILDRVNAIEKLVITSSSLSFFIPAKARGLHYTTQDEQGKTVDHWEAHFVLGPLERALLNYIRAYNQSPRLTGSDWRDLNNSWIKVGLHQREFPAHIAQEYCHPDRSFQDVSQNKSLLDASNPSNLKRQLTFYNDEIEANDYWFTRGTDSSHSNLGSSFAINRSWKRCGMRSEGGGAGAVGAQVDLSVITAIDGVRACDLKESLDNLSGTMQHPRVF